MAGLARADPGRRTALICIQGVLRICMPREPLLAPTSQLGSGKPPRRPAATQASPWSDHGRARRLVATEFALLGRHRRHNDNISRFPQCFETRERSLFRWPRFYRPLHPRWGYRFYPVGPTDLPDLEVSMRAVWHEALCHPKAEPHPKTGQQVQSKRCPGRYVGQLDCCENRRRKPRSVSVKDRSGTECQDREIGAAGANQGQNQVGASQRRDIVNRITEYGHRLGHPRRRRSTRASTVSGHTIT